MSDYDKKRQYQSLLNNMRYARNKLGYAINNLNKAATAMPDAYSIDEESADNGYLKKRVSEMSSLYKSMNTVISRIEKEIKALDALEEEE